MLAVALPKYIRLASRQEGGLVPHVVRCCVEEVERRGMDEVGIYRVSGGAPDISTLKAAFDSSKASNGAPRGCYATTSMMHASSSALRST